MTTNNSVDECGITRIVDKSKQEMSAFAYSVETISVQLNKRKEERTADSDQVIVSVKDEGPGIDPS
jgi:signal transduction histidine kinase